MATRFSLVVLCLFLGKLPSAQCQATPSCSYMGVPAEKTGDCVCEAGMIGPSCNQLNNKTNVPLANGFQMDDFHVWGSQVVYAPGEQDGRPWQMIASIYPKNLSFGAHWTTNAQIARASSVNMTGPYQYEELILGYRSESYWDRTVMNPKLVYSPTEKVWVVIYTGDTYPGPMPSVAHDNAKELYNKAQSSQRVGAAASSKLVNGTWDRLDKPVLDVRPEPAWDSRITDNPSVTVLPNGTYFMIYKASHTPEKQTTVCFGVATATSWKGPWVRGNGGNPIFPCPEYSFYGEDSTVWFDKNSNSIQMIAKDFGGHFTHDGYSGFHAYSLDGHTFNVTSPALAYLPRQQWSDGKIRSMDRQERCQMIVNTTDGSPLGMSYATNTALNGSKLYWTFVVPLREGLHL